MQGVPHGFKAEGDNLPGALRAMADVEAAMPDWAKAAVAASSNACFLSSLFGRATTFFLTQV
ncbi:Uncharacterised protein [Klebsiella variicola]|nr:hypothetical protein APT91_24790 [Klebsiella pneumoniae]SXE22746.1 Uncharacterised protein [Klebsiella variicola]KSY61535.1 hypothetical protein APU08_08345 [Klebsiella pneumoniae]SWF11067.1 Uncharacterised protein [Klebsiella pneumoniae]VAU23050.1 Uncharacterised protein [Klebsiella pneumoniae]